MATNHSTTNAEQHRTDTWLVFDDVWSSANLHLIGQVEVPRFSQPDGTGVELSRDKRLALAVARAVEDPGSFIESYNDPHSEIDDTSEVEGEEFAVMSELGQEVFEWVEYEQNPAFDGVWDPESDA